MMDLSQFQDRIRQGGHLALLTVRPGPVLMAVLVEPPQVTLLEAEVGESYPSLAADVPQTHWFERAIWDMAGITATGHPRFKSLILHEAWPEGFCPWRDDAVPQGAPRSYQFLHVQGEGVYEIPVGPIHAGIIEPGHFRFSCLGEIIENLEIRLGYQHRGLERQMASVPWRRLHFWAESASSDTSAGNALAHAWAMEDLLGVVAPPQAVLRRGMALELERVANHLGDLGGLCGDIGYLAGATVFGRLRGDALGLAEWLSGSRFLTSYIVPGGLLGPREAAQGPVRQGLERLERVMGEALDVCLDEPALLDRMEGVGRLRPRLAHQFGMVGPAGRASGQAYDVRKAFAQAPWSGMTWTPPCYETGDVLARAQVRADELRASLTMLRAWVERLETGDVRVDLPDALPADRYGVGLVEAWRGELLHLLRTGPDGGIVRYAIKDPSFHNWTGLAIAGRGQLVGDFPLCNKSFSLSYSGNDL